MGKYHVGHQKTCLLTMDLENDCGGRVGAKFDAINEHTIQTFSNFMKVQNIPLTVFVTGKIFEEKEREIRELHHALPSVEFALHSYSHLNPPDALADSSAEIEKGVQAYIKAMGQSPYGYRSPLGYISTEDFACLKKYGFLYDSSIFPTIRPGLFNYLHMPNMPFYMKEFDIVEIPCSVFPWLNIPLGLGYMRLLGMTLTRILCLRLASFPILVIGFHLHDVIQTTHTERLRGFWKFFYRRNVKQGFSILQFVINTLKTKGYEFELMKNIAAYQWG
jgi:peptidoglycan/xylan/chitin deacetylase (PgdA/CDA1 family)